MHEATIIRRLQRTIVDTAPTSTSAFRLREPSLPGEIEAILGSFAKYEKRLLIPVRQWIKSDIVRHKKLNFEVSNNLLWGRPGAKGRPPHISVDLRMRADFLREVNEIAESRRRLGDTLIMIRRYPFGGTKITKVRWLHFCLLAYLSEIYALQERLLLHIRRVRKKWKNGTGRPNVMKVAAVLDALVKWTLEPIVSARGKHMHQFTFEPEEISRAILWEWLSSSESSHFSSFADLFHSKARIDWRNVIKSNNDTLDRLLDIVAWSLDRVVMDKAGQLKPRD